MYMCLWENWKHVGGEVKLLQDHYIILNVWQHSFNLFVVCKSKYFFVTGATMNETVPNISTLDLLSALKHE